MLRVNCSSACRFFSLTLPFNFLFHAFLPLSIAAPFQSFRITTENVDILTEIGILYLRINDNNKAFDKLFEVTKLYESCSKALLALGSILQVNAQTHKWCNAC